MPLMSSSWGRFNSEEARAFQPAFDSFHHLVDHGDHSLSKMHRRAPPRSKLHDKRIAPVFQVEFESLGRIYGCAPRRLAIAFRKRHRGVLEQENSADPSVDVAGDPKPFFVSADEKRRNSVAEDVGTEPLKRRGDDRRFAGRPDPCAVLAGFFAGDVVAGTWCG